MKSPKQHNPGPKMTKPAPKKDSKSLRPAEPMNMKNCSAKAHNCNIKMC